MESVSRIWANKFTYGGSDFRLDPIYATIPAASENNALFKKGQNRLKIIISLCKSKSVTHSVEDSFIQDLVEACVAARAI